MHDTDSEDDYDPTDEEPDQQKMETEQWTKWKKRQCDRIWTEHNRKHKKLKTKRITTPQIKKHANQITNTRLVSTLVKQCVWNKHKKSKWDEAIPATIKNNPLLYWLYKDGPTTWRRKLHDNHTEPEGIRTNQLLQWVYRTGSKNTRRQLYDIYKQPNTRKMPTHVTDSENRNIGYTQRAPTYKKTRKQMTNMTDEDRIKNNTILHRIYQRGSPKIREKLKQTIKKYHQHKRQEMPLHTTQEHNTHTANKTHATTQKKTARNVGTEQKQNEQHEQERHKRRKK